MAEASRLSVIATPAVRPPAHGLEHTAHHAGWANPLTLVPGAASDGRPECFVDRNGMLFANSQSSSKFCPATLLNDQRQAEQGGSATPLRWKGDAAQPV